MPLDETQPADNVFVSTFAARIREMRVTLNTIALDPVALELLITNFAVFQADIATVVSDLATVTADLANTTADLATANAQLATFVPINVDTSAGPIIKTLPTTGTHVSYIKTTDDGNEVSFVTSDGSTFAEPGLTLSGQFQRKTFDRVGNIWHRG